MLRKTIKSWWVAHHLETWSKVPTKGTKRGQAPRDHGHSCLLGHTFQKLKPFPPKKLQCMKNSFSFPRERIDAILTSPCMSFPFSRFSLHLPSVVGTVNDILLLSTKVLWMNDIIRGEVWCSLRYFWPFGISKNATCKFSICRSNTRGLQWRHWAIWIDGQLSSQCFLSHWTWLLRYSAAVTLLYQYFQTLFSLVWRAAGELREKAQKMVEKLFFWYYHQQKS